jgi:hypothetical protein
MKILCRDVRRHIITFLSKKSKVYFASCSNECFEDVCHITCWKDSNETYNQVGACVREIEYSFSLGKYNLFQFMKNISIGGWDCPLLLNYLPTCGRLHTLQMRIFGVDQLISTLQQCFGNTQMSTNLLHLTIQLPEFYCRDYRIQPQLVWESVAMLQNLTHLQIFLWRPPESFDLLKHLPLKSLSTPNFSINRNKEYWNFVCFHKTLEKVNFLNSDCHMMVDEYMLTGPFAARQNHGFYTSSAFYYWDKQFTYWAHSFNNIETLDIDSFDISNRMISEPYFPKLKKIQVKTLLCDLKLLNWMSNCLPQLEELCIDKQFTWLYGDGENSLQSTFPSQSFHNLKIQWKMIKQTSSRFCLSMMFPQVTCLTLDPNHYDHFDTFSKKDCWDVKEKFPLLETLHLGFWDTNKLIELSDYYLSNNKCVKTLNESLDIFCWSKHKTKLIETKEELEKTRLEFRKGCEEMHAALRKHQVQDLACDNNEENKNQIEEETRNPFEIAHSEALESEYSHSKIQDKQIKTLLEPLMKQFHEDYKTLYSHNPNKHEIGSWVLLSEGEGLENHQWSPCHFFHDYHVGIDSVNAFCYRWGDPIDETSLERGNIYLGNGSIEAWNDEE